MSLDWNRANALVMAAQHMVLVTHIKPDGDAIGSLLGMAWALRQLGKDVVVAVDDGVPPFLRFLPGAEDVQSALNDGIAPDLVIALDCGDETRMGQVGKVATANGAVIINLDHHITNNLFGQVNLVDTQTVAAAEGVFDWLPRLGVTLDARIATCLLAGIVTDTLCFRTSNVTAVVLGKAQKLMEWGASLGEITQRTVMRKSYAALQLWTHVLPSICLEDRVIWAVVDKVARQASHYAGNGDGGLVSLLNLVNEADIAAVFRELEDGRVEIGMRARPGFDVAEVALSIGGGGHALASGATVEGPLDLVVSKTIEKLHRAVEQGEAVVC